MKLNASYAAFYAEGREEKVLKQDIDTEALADKVIAGEGSPYELALAAATTAAAVLQADRKRRVWFEENEDAINAAGGDKDEAYRHYVQGRVDELAGALEAEIVEVMCEDLLEGDDDDDDDDDDDEEPEEH